MTKRGVLILTAAALALTAFSIALSRRDSSDWRATRARRLFPFPWQETSGVAITRPDGRVSRFEKAPGGEWRVRLDGELADSLSFKTVDELAALATLAWREPLREGRAPVPERAVRLTAFGAAGQRVELAFGDIANNMRAVVVDGDDSAVYGVSQDLLKFLDWPDRRHRNLYLASAESGKRPNRIALSPGAAADGNPLDIVLERRADGWRLVEPVAWPVDETRLDMLLRWIDRLRADSIEAEFAGDSEWFGFGPESPFIEIRYADGDGVLSRRVEFGREKEGGDAIYARVAGRNPIFGLDAGALSEISMDAAAEYPDQWKNFYRRRAVNVAGSEMPAAVVVERLLPSPAKITLEQVRDRDGARWRGVLEENGAVVSFPVDPPAPEDQMRPLTAVIAGLSSLRVRTFLADAGPGPDTIRWTAFPAWRFTCRAADGTPGPTLTLYAANAEGALPPGEPFVPGLAGPQEMKPLDGFGANPGVAFSIDDRKAIMEMYGELAYLLCLPPYRYRSAKVLDSDPRTWARVEIVREGSTTIYTRDGSGLNEQWWLDSDTPEPLMDDNNLLVALLLELSQLRTPGYVADAGAAPEEFGLDRPEINAIVYSFNKAAAGETEAAPLFRLSLGKQAGNDGAFRYARLDGGGPVFLVSARMAEALGAAYR